MEEHTFVVLVSSPI